MKSKKGFSLVEMLVASTIILILVGSIYMLITTTQTTHMTEGRKLDMNQSARSLENILYDNIRSAGSMLTMLHTSLFLSKPTPFSGICPLNNNNYPDGIILASGDQNAATKLDVAFSNTGTTVEVNTVFKNDGTVAWAENDYGVIVREKGYYVFKVTAVDTGNNRLTVRSEAAYYSGLLNTTNYDDVTDDYLGESGIANSYPIGSPVVRLNFFNIFLVKTEADGSRTLTLTTDCGHGSLHSDPIANEDHTNGRAVPIVTNIEDIQFEYLERAETSIDSQIYWASLNTNPENANPCETPGSTECENFLKLFLARRVDSIKIYLLFKTEEEKNKRSTGGITYAKPIMGDVSAVVLPKGRFHYQYSTYEITLRNFKIAY